MYIFNLNYKLRYDETRLVLIDEYRRGGEEFKGFVHPVYAWIINLFDGKTELDKVVDKMVDSLGITQEQATVVIKPLLEIKETKYIRYDGIITTLPADVIIPNKKNEFRERLNDEFFTSVTQPDHACLRLNRPLTLLLCPSLRCYTDCIYCYADRKYPHVEQNAAFWAALVRQAKQQGIDRIDVTGGEFFMIKDWQQIAAALVECGYTPEISTKIPLTESTLDDILKSGLGCVQYSLDTLDTELAVDTLKVTDSYIDNLLRSIRYADSIGLKVILKPTLCKATCTEANVRRIIEFADTLANVRRVVISTIGFSCYKSRGLYAQIRPNIQQVEELRILIEELQQGRNYPVIDDSFTYRPHEMQSEKAFNDRALCTANMDGFVILPDGKVTICEELYWHPSFIIGDCTEKSITEIWKSEKATRLYFLKESDFPEDSACGKCSIISTCRTQKGVCWKLVLAAYGMDKPFHPDPRCTKSGKTDDSFLIP